MFLIIKQLSFNIVIKFVVIVIIIEQVVHFSQVTIIFIVLAIIIMLKFIKAIIIRLESKAITIIFIKLILLSKYFN
jgi:hypothetical protein